MIFIPSLTSVVEVLLVVVPVLLTVAFVTVAERKTMASMQRRLGPNVVGYWGLLQAFADALKLLLKEYVSPTQANIVLFFLGPIITLLFSLLGYAVVPYGPGLAIWDFNLGILYMLAVSSLSTYGILLAGWSANSKYAFLGSLRSTAQLISYELILSSAILLVVLLTGSLNLTVNIEFQRAVWFAIPLLPVFLIFFIGSVAETNRAPFDLAEAESELVSGFMTEHAAVIFVFFFLAEYASIVLICILTSILFLGGYLLNYIPFLSIIKDVIEYLFFLPGQLDLSADFSCYPVAEGLLYGLSLGLKSSILIFTFIWVRASFPRIRYDQLMSYSWTVLLPIVIAFIVLVPCILYGFEIIPTNMALLFMPLYKVRSNINKPQVKHGLTIVMKVLMIFLFGFFTRIAIHYFLDINVFKDFFTGVSILYYLVFSCFVVYINDFLVMDNVLALFSLLFTHIWNNISKIYLYLYSYLSDCFLFLLSYLKEAFLNALYKVYRLFLIISKSFHILNDYTKVPLDNRSCDSGFKNSPSSKFISFMNNDPSSSNNETRAGSSRGARVDNNTTLPIKQEEVKQEQIKQENDSSPEPGEVQGNRGLPGPDPGLAQGNRGLLGQLNIVLGSYAVLPDGKFLIVDPNRFVQRGFLDPATGEPYDEQQPTLSNFRRALEHDAGRYPGVNCKVNPDIFTGGAKQYFIEYLNYWDPGWKTSGSVRNSRPFRNGMRSWED